MSVSTAMFSAITGLNAMGTAMSVIGNNIANVNTVGFKSSRANFQDLLSQSAHTASGKGQIGRGVSMGSVTQVFSQGAFQNSSQDTDIAIGGEGFFQVRDQLTSQKYYTRAGNFIFDADGRLINPAGYVLQGWELDANGDRVGTPTDVRMVTFNADPKATTLAHYVSNLDAKEESRTDGAHLSTVWDGAQDQPITGNDYVYQTSLRVFDSLGNGHDLSVYFDPDDATANKWDFIVCCDPDEDKRRFEDLDSLGGGPAGNYVSPTAMAGLLQRGTITFNPNTGAIDAITAEELRYDSSLAPNDWYWTASTVTGGYYHVNAAFLTDPNVDLGANPTADNSITQDIAVNFGAKFGGGVWRSDNLATTQYAAASTTIFQTQDGYASGYLQRVSIDPDGILTGTYSNGQNRAVFQIGLVQFRNQWGLDKLGENLYGETRLSGQATINPPGTGGTGTIAPNALEQSNVDLAEEFVDMIIQQRGFQANSKIITTTDAMLSELIQMKR